MKFNIECSIFIVLLSSITDICIGGIFPSDGTLKHTLMSATYASDDLTWCVQKAQMMPMFLAQISAVEPAVWFLAFFGYGYPIGLLLYLLIQFDLKYRQRNHTDWHHTTLIITLPAFLGLSPNFKPLKGTVRIFYALFLISAFFVFQIAFTRAYNVLHAQRPWHQVSSLAEIMEMDFLLTGSLEAFNLLSRNEMVI